MAQKKIRVQTIGCRLNQYETEKMAEALQPYGFTRVRKGEIADLYVINTCTVTHRADSDSRYLIRKAARENPNGRIVVAGCYVDNDPQKIEGMEQVDVIIRNAEKNDIVSILKRKLPDLLSEEPDKSCSDVIGDFFDHNRAWIKISDGCNQWCSFCIIPSVRGRLRNRPAGEIIREINRLVENGYNEVVLTGVHLGHYKNRKVEPQVKNLAHLCRMIISETDLHRLRLSSIEPQTVREELVQTYADSNGRICRHFHMPLQSGSSNVLKKMLRPYDQNTYIRRVTAVKKANPETIVGGDVIVGFPGETEEDFQKTMSVCDSGLLDYLHVFSYSDRPGTPASELGEKINPVEIKRRNRELTIVSHAIRARSYKRQVGQTLEVIAENRSREGGFYWGVADNYVKVKLSDIGKSTKDIVRVKITRAHDDYVEGDVVT